MQSGAAYRPDEAGKAASRADVDHAAARGQQRQREGAVDDVPVPERLFVGGPREPRQFVGLYQQRYILPQPGLVLVDIFFYFLGRKAFDHQKTPR